jgi:riboflavin biosynthesis pyrimidine reductase
VNIETSLLFNVPEVPVFLLISPEGLRRVEPALRDRPWITVVSLADGGLPHAFRRLRVEHGLKRISVVGGRTVATALLDAGLIQDLCLTTSAIDGGKPNTPLYAGHQPPRLELIVRKRGTGDSGITFEQFAVARPGGGYASDAERPTTARSTPP